MVEVLRSNAGTAGWPRICTHVVPWCITNYNRGHNSVLMHCLLSSLLCTSSKAHAHQGCREEVGKGHTGGGAYKRQQGLHARTAQGVWQGRQGSIERCWWVN